MALAVLKFLFALGVLDRVGIERSALVWPRIKDPFALVAKELVVAVLGHVFVGSAERARWQRH
jgi:hypothetical protein